MLLRQPRDSVLGGARPVDLEALWDAANIARHGSGRKARDQADLLVYRLGVGYHEPPVLS